MQRKIGDRRIKPRFEIVGDLWGSVDVNASLTVVNLGRGGALLESPVALPPDSVHTMLALLDDESYTITARVRHSTATILRGRRAYLLGVEFLNASEAFDDFLTRQTALGNDSQPVEA